MSNKDNWKRALELAKEARLVHNAMYEAAQEHWGEQSLTGDINNETLEYLDEFYNTFGLKMSGLLGSLEGTCTGASE